MSLSNDWKMRLQPTVVYSTRLCVTVLLALFCFCTVGAYVPRKRRNPAAQIGIPAMEVKDKSLAQKKTIARRELYEYL